VKVAQLAGLETDIRVRNCRISNLSRSTQFDMRKPANPFAARVMETSIAVSA
jgi:hypothetical protein